MTPRSESAFIWHRRQASHFRDREFAPVLARAMSFTPVEVRVPYIPARFGSKSYSSG